MVRRHRWTLVVTISLLLALAGCMGATLPATGPTPEPPPFVPLSLIVEPTPWSVSPLPTVEAAGVFQWPSNRQPSLIFVFDDGAT